MASSRFKSVFGACIAGSLMFSSTPALASTPAAPQHVDPWAVLAAMSGGAPAAAICGTALGAAAATQPAPTGCVLPVVDAPPPPNAAGAPNTYSARAPDFNPLLAALPALAGAVAIYFVARGHGYARTGYSSPNSAF